MNVTRLHKMAASQVCGMPLETLVVGAEDGSYTVHMVSLGGRCCGCCCMYDSMWHLAGMYANHA